MCVQFLKNHITDNICVIYELANQSKHKELEKRCIEHIERNIKTIFASENFLKYDQKMLQKILQMGSLACREVEVLEALVKWIKTKIEPAELTQQIIQEKFSDLWHEIRFGSITLAEFVRFSTNYYVLFTLAEHTEIFQMIYSEQFQPKIFKANQRNGFGPIDSIEWTKNDVAKCYRLINWSKIPYFIKNHETTSFTVNRPVALRSFSCCHIYRFGKCFEYLEVFLEGTITIFEISDPKFSNRKVVLFKEEHMFKNQNETSLTLIDKPVVIRPERQYEIQIDLELPSTGNLCTKVKFEREVHVHPDIIVKFHNDTIIENEARGLIDSLDFYRY